MLRTAVAGSAKFKINPHALQLLLMYQIFEPQLPGRKFVRQHSTTTALGDLQTPKIILKLAALISCVALLPRVDWFEDLAHDDVFSERARNE